MTNRLNDTNVKIACFTGRMNYLFKSQILEKDETMVVIGPACSGKTCFSNSLSNVCANITVYEFQSVNQISNDILESARYFALSVEVNNYTLSRISDQIPQCNDLYMRIAEKMENCTFILLDRKDGSVRYFGY
ncbi:MAG: hypothetical protein ACRCZI_13005 [Cetobacterium sp.]